MCMEFLEPRLWAWWVFRAELGQLTSDGQLGSFPWAFCLSKDPFHLKTSSRGLWRVPGRHTLSCRVCARKRGLETALS